MLKFNKVLNSKIISLIVICVFLVTNTAYGIDLCKEPHLRKPLDFNNIDNETEGRYSRSLEAVSGTADDGQIGIEKKENPGDSSPGKYMSFARTRGALFIALLFFLLPISGLASEQSNLYEALQNKGISTSALNYLQEYTEISKKIDFVNKAYELLAKKGITFEKRYNVIFISEPAIEGRVIVLDKFNRMFIDLNQFPMEQFRNKKLDEANMNKLAVLVAEGSSRLDAKDGSILEQSAISNVKKLDAMSKLGMPTFDQEVISLAHKAIYRNEPLRQSLGLSEDEFNKAMLEVMAINKNNVIKVVLKFGNVNIGVKEYKNYERVVFVFPDGRVFPASVDALKNIDEEGWRRINAPFTKNSSGNYLHGPSLVLPGVFQINLKAAKAEKILLNSI